MIAEVLSGYFSDFGETVTVDGDTVTAIFDGGYAETLDAAGTSPSLFLIRADVSTVAVGDPVVRAGVSYTVRNILPEPPDEKLVRLVLEQQ
jgi:hypothetical protein